MEMPTILLIFFTAFIPRFLAAHRVDMTWDEGLYALGGMIAIRNITTFNFSPKAWSFEFHSPVAMYLYGIAYSLYVIIATILKQGFNLNFNSLYENGISLFTGRRTLLIIRLPSIILGSLSCVLTYLICLDVFKSEMVGIMAALLLALAPSFIAWSSLAMLESGVTFFYLLTILSLLRAVQYGSIGFAMISGISLGLAFGSKETGFGLPLVLLPWLAFLLPKTYVAWGLSAVVGKFWFLPLWLLLGVAVFYVMSPSLWRNPINRFRENLGATSKMTSRPNAGWGFYVTNLLASTPTPLAFLYFIGILGAVVMAFTQVDTILILSWIIVPLALMSMPFVPKRGGAYEVTFVLPPLSILAGLALQGLSLIVVNVSGWTFGYQPLFVVLGVAFIGLTVFKCINIHPYYIDYYNFFGRKAEKKFPVGWWGEGMSKAIAYVDQYAPPNSTIWIYGPKATSLYHSSRVDLKRSIRNESLFYERTKAGFDVQVGDHLHAWRKGDLRFYLPYYYPNEYDGLNLAQLKVENVSFIVIYRWAIYDPAVTAVDLGNYKIISALRDNYTPVFTARIKDMEVCWVYKVSDLEG